MKSNPDGLTSAVEEPRDAAGEPETQPQPREDGESAPRPARKSTELEDKQARVSGGKPVTTRRSNAWDFRARGEPFVWGLGGALVIGIFMIIGFLIFVLYNGVATFYPKRGR